MVFMAVVVTVSGSIFLYWQAVHQTTIGAPEIVVADGTDPKVTGCANDATTADKIDVYMADQYLAGVLELRTSQHCGTSWGKFTQVSGLPESPTLEDYSKRLSGNTRLFQD
jgi:hypothetical protein